MTQVLLQPQQKTPPKRRRRIFIRRYLLATPVALVLAVAAMEIFLRAYFGFAHPLLYQSDAACGYIVRPAQDIVRLRAHNFINHAGMRSPEFSETHPAETLRVLLVGDSVTYGTTYVTQDQIFPTRIAAELPADVHEPVEVLNGSVGGWAPANEVAFLKSRGTHQADIVLMVWNSGDLGQSFAPFPGGLSFPTKNPATAIGEVWSRYLSPRLFGGGPEADPGSLPTDATAKEAQQAVKNLELLTEAKTFVEKAGARFGMVYVPSGPAFQTPPHLALRDRFIQWAADTHVPLFDLTGAFSHEAGNDIWIDGTHLKPHGDELVAKEVVGDWKERFAAAGKKAAD